MRRGLIIILAEDSEARIHAGLSLAVAAVALGRPVAMFFQGEAVRAVGTDRCWTGGDAHRAVGSPTVMDLFVQAREMDIAITACETGLHMTGVTQKTLRPGVETGGLIGTLAAHSDDEIVMV